MKPATLIIAIALAVPAGCWRSQEVASGADTDTEDTESGGMTDPETDPVNGWTWEVMESGTINDLTGVWGTSYDDVYAVGKSGIILHYDGNDDLQWTQMEFPTEAPGSDLGDISGVQYGYPVAVGSSGTAVALVSDSWTVLPTGTDENLHGVCLHGETSGWAVGDNGSAFHFNGVDWQPVATGVTQTLMDVACSVDVGYAVGHLNSSGMSSVVLRLEGSNSTAVDHPTGHFMYAADAFAAWEVTIAGYYQESQEAGPYFAVYTYANEQWTLRGTAEYSMILGVSNTFLGDIYAVGYDAAEASEAAFPVIYRMDSYGGVDCYVHPDPGALRAIWEVPSMEDHAFFTVGDDGLILKGQLQ